MMHKFLFIIFPLCVSQIFSSCGKTDDDNGLGEPTPQQEAQYDVLELGEIPIGLWVTPPPEYQNSDEYRKIREAGMNFVNGFTYFENSNSRIMQVLDYCQQHGLKYFANRGVVADDLARYAQQADAALLKKFTDGIRPYADHPAFAGELLIDEPGKPLFGAVAAFTDAFQKEYPDKMWHVNLLPTYATGAIRAPNYLDYINSWMEILSPNYISYDSYPLLTDGTIISDYYYNLDLIRAKSRFKEIPFWTFIQTLSIGDTPGVPDKREPSEADIRWQVWSNLAFGAKGIQYFCYWTPGSGTEQFGDALIGLNGEKTIRYDYVKKLNADINAIGKILMECHAEGVIQTAAQSYDLYEPRYEFGEIIAISGDDNIVGCFESKDGDKKVLITTLRPDRDANIALQVSENVTSVTVWRNGISTQEQVQDNKLSFNIKAGEAVFVEF